MNTLLFILDWGKNGLGALWLAYFGVAGFLAYQTYVARKSGGVQQGKTGLIYDDKKTPLKKIPQFWGVVIVTIAAIVIHIAIQSSYKKSNKPRPAPVEQNDGREAAEDMLKK